MTKIGWIKFLMETALSAVLLSVIPLSVHVRVLLLIFWIIMQFMVGRYGQKVLLVWDELRLMLLSFSTTWIVGLLSLDWTTHIPKRGIFWVTVFVVLDLIGCLVITRYAHLWFWKKVKHNVLIIGQSKEAALLEDVCAHNRFSLLDVEGLIDVTTDPNFADVVDERVPQKKPVWPLSEMEQIAREKHIDTILIAIPRLSRQNFRDLYKRITPLVENIQYMPRAEGQINFASQINDFDGQLLISTSRGHIRPWHAAVKRTIDIIGSIPGILAVLPLMGYVSFLNHRNGDHGPLFFKQQRIGKDGQLFEMLKFRTMVVNADEVLENLLANNKEMAQEYATMKKLKEDPRITKAGKYLRKSGIDEFPQFINVFKGDMSLVGPRPYLPREKADMKEAYNEIIKVKPGITGMWQTHGRNDLTFEERLELDDYYNHNWSMWLDVTIFIKTLKSMLAKEENGAY